MAEHLEPNKYLLLSFFYVEATNDFPLLTGGDPFLRLGCRKRFQVQKQLVVRLYTR